MWQNIILVGLGSMAGGISRYFVSTWSRQLFPMSFPWGTLIVNLVGCFLLGLFSGIFISHHFSAYRLFFAIGFCGSFTTFSTFSFENLQLLSQKAYGLFSLNISLSLILGIVFAGLGYLITHK